MTGIGKIEVRAHADRHCADRPPLCARWTDLHYDSILDVADLVQLEQYKIGTLFR